MFIHINILDKTYKEIVIKITDTQFVAIVKIDNSQNNKNIHIIREEIAIIKEYSERKLNVAKALAAYYLKVFEAYHLTYNVDRINDGDILLKLIRYRTCIDLEYPNLQYGDKIFPCVLRQMKQLLSSRS